MSDFDRYTRVNKFEKRRKNTKLMTVLLIAASFLVILLLGLWIFGPEDEPTDSNEIASSDNTNSEDNNEEETDVASEEESTQTEESSSQTEESNSGVTDESNNETETNESTDSQNVETEVADPAGEDDNVIEAYTAEWQPIGTEQEGPHTTQFDTESQDWLEMEQAIRVATGLTEQDMITWFIGNGGHQKAIGTVTNKAETEIYRVYLSWVDNEGWQPTLVELLKENDKK
ncbi:YrrS family protein [Ornithinibacillus californiensis]|uniref:YrrS family protein n=1 Tax=Ornithinibacillus californiensis TaxID=161536 RepID=UPI00064DAD84|nr:YrrS family protein [Ornithinibacillus californiensis]